MVYKSKYYDPEKAHEYYMRTRELKGYENRYGGSRGDGTSAASTTGFLSDSKRKELKAQQHNTRIQNRIDKISSNTSAEEQIDADQQGNRLHTAKQIAGVKNEIAKLQENLRNMSAEDRKANRDIVKQQVKELRKKIKRLRYEQEVKRDELSRKKHEASLAKKDAAQRLKQQTKGGSTSGFNKKGKEAAAYIKRQMEDERKNLVRKINNELDKKMLTDVKKFAEHIKRLRASGQGFDNNKILGQINSFASRVSKQKDSISKRTKEDYKQYYKDEIDKLRTDDSMFTYWDNRKKSEKKYAKSQRLKDRLRRIRYGYSSGGSNKISGQIGATNSSVGKVSGNIGVRNTRSAIRDKADDMFTQNRKTENDSRAKFRKKL